MKMSKSILAAVLGLSMAGLCNAGTVYVTGSSAMRSIFYNACMHAGTVFSNAPTYTVYQGGSTGNNAGNGGNYMAFSGALVGGGGGTTTIQCHWTGSEGGIADVATAAQNTFIASPDGTDHGTNVPSTTSQNVNLAMADKSQT